MSDLTSRPTTPALLVLVAVLLASCAGAGGTGSSATPTSSRTPSPAATPSSSPTGPDETPSPSSTGSPTTTPTASADPSPSSQGRVLAAQFSAFVGALGGPADCTIGVEELPHVGLLEARRFTIGAQAVVCLVGFSFDEPIVLEVGWPDGGRTVEVVFADAPEQVDLRDTPGPLLGWVDPFDGSGRIETWIRPGTPAGKWRLTATQGDDVAMAEIAVGPGATPRLQRTEGPDAATLRFLVSGFPPGETPVGLYDLPMTSPEPGEDVASARVTVTLERRLATIEADRDGAGTLDVDVSDVGPGRWCIDTAATIDDGFCEATLGPRL